MIKFKQILGYKTLINYISANVINSFIAIFSGFFIYRYINPGLLGIWSMFLVFETYATVTRMGIVNGLGRELPYELGRNNLQLAHKYASTGLSYSLLSNLFLIIIVPYILIYQISLKNEFEYFFCFSVILIRVIGSTYSGYLAVTFRTNQNFDTLSKITYIQAAFKLILIILVVFYGFYGLVIRELIISLLEVALLHIKRPLKIKPKLDFPSLYKLFKIGFPLFIVSYLTSFVNTLPRLYIINESDVYHLGLFSPVLILLNSASLVPTAIASYLYPKLSFSYGSQQDAIALWHKLKYVLIASIIISIPISIAVFLFVDKILYFFPKYLASATYLKVSAISILFIAYSSSNVIFAVLKKYTLMYAYLVIYFIVQVISIYVLKMYLIDILLISVLSILFTFMTMYIFSFLFSYLATHIKTVS